jgi:hypothetical protein
MVSKRTIRVESKKISPKRVTAQWGVTKGYDDGVILFPEGAVSVMMQGDAEHFHLTRMDAVVDGRHVIVTENRRYTRLSVIRWARKHLLALV